MSKIEQIVRLLGYEYLVTQLPVHLMACDTPLMSPCETLWLYASHKKLALVPHEFLLARGETSQLLLACEASNFGCIGHSKPRLLTSDLHNYPAHPHADHWLIGGFGAPTAAQISKICSWLPFDSTSVLMTHSEQCKVSIREAMLLDATSVTTTTITVTIKHNDNNVAIDR